MLTTRILSCAAPALIRGDGFADLFERFSRILAGSPINSAPEGRLVLDSTPSIASIIPDDADDADDARHAGDSNKHVKGKMSEWK